MASRNKKEASGDLYFHIDVAKKRFDDWGGAAAIDEDHCNADGSMCLYHNICYETGDDLWYALSNLKQFPLLHDGNSIHVNTKMSVKSKCTYKVLLDGD